jgi:hypothetical protein
MVIQELTTIDLGLYVEVEYWMVSPGSEAKVSQQIARETLLTHLAQEGIPNCCTSALLDQLYDTEAYLTDNLHSVCEGYLKEGIK